MTSGVIQVDQNITKTAKKSRAGLLNQLRYGTPHNTTSNKHNLHSHYNTSLGMRFLRELTFREIS